MKKTLLLAIILICSIVFTACGDSPETPTDMARGAQETISGSKQENQDIAQDESNAQQNVQVSQKDEVATTFSETAKDTAFGIDDNSVKVSSQSNSKQDDVVTADIDIDNTPKFSSETAFRNWMLTNNTEDQFTDERNILLSVMTAGDQIVYYRPIVGTGNNLLQLDRIKLAGATLIYYYRFVDETYSDLELQISCYMDDSFKENYLEAVKDLETQVYGYICTNVNNHDVLYRDNQHGATVFLWQQFGGYICATLEGENHADMVQDVLPYLNLEKVTLRTDTVTQ